MSVRRFGVPSLHIDRSTRHGHLRSRGSYRLGSEIQRPTRRFDRTASEIQRSASQSDRPPSDIQSPAPSFHGTFSDNQRSACPFQRITSERDAATHVNDEPPHESNGTICLSDRSPSASEPWASRLEALHSMFWPRIHHSGRYFRSLYVFRIEV